jgi:hypothetical protein
MLERLKKKCLLVWEKYKDSPGGYYQEKYDRVMACTHPDDYDYLISMFDHNNVMILHDLLDDEEKEYYKEFFDNYFNAMNAFPISFLSKLLDD